MSVCFFNVRVYTIKYFFFCCAIAVAPNVVFAAGGADDLFSLSTLLLKLLSSVLPVLFGLALIYFIWGVVKFFLSQDNEQARTTARQHVFYGIIAMFVMVSVWGLVNVLVETFGTDTTTAPVEVQFK